MDLTPLIILSSLLLIIGNPPLVSSAACSISKCAGLGNPDIRFPFWIQDSKQSKSSSCGYPGFEVSCDGSKLTLIDLPRYGRFSVKSIDYAAQELWVNDPSSCLPERLLTLDLSGSPFTGVYFQDFTFLNCSKNLVSQNAHLGDLNLIGPIPCLGGSHYSVFALPTNSSATSNRNATWLSHAKCFPIVDTVKVPIQWPMSLQNQTEVSSLNEDLRLSWFMPECRSCELDGQMCGLNATNSSGSPMITCWNIPNSGKLRKLPISTFAAVILVICLPSIICLLGSLIIWIRACSRPSPHAQLDHPTFVTTPMPGHLAELGLVEAAVGFTGEVLRLGLNGEPSEEVRPKIVESEVEEAGPIEESMCSICMSEYEPKDKIGTLPMCGHYFHANCINGWLRSRRLLLDRTCPICRARVGS